MRITCFLLTIIFLISFSGYASHIVGGEMYYDCLGNNQYRITLKIYRDCFSSGADFDSPLPVTIFTGNDQFVRVEDVPYPGNTTIPVTFSNPCVTPPNNICVQEAIYTKVITLAPSASGYKLAYQRCCRGPAVQNLLNADDVGLTLLATIPPAGIADCNSSPRFSEFPPLMLCNNDPLVFDHSATDPDGDQLVYELCAPYNGGTTFDPLPNPADAPPYSLVPWESGFSAAVPLGPGSSVTIDPTTGVLSADPNLTGLFAVGVCVKEYRNGTLIGTTTRDFLFRVINCQIQLTSEITPQEEMEGFTSYCEGLTITFENDSFNGDTYFWDFGVSGTNADTSLLITPTYTFPSAGDYEVTLIVNRGWPCTDTSKQIFRVYEEFYVQYTAPPPQCIENNNFSFQTDGQFNPATTTITWNFGNEANTTQSQDVNPQNIVFNTSGYHTVTLSADNGVCQSVYTDSVLVFKIPTIDFYLDTGLMCAPYLARFYNSSQADTEIIYAWDFGDGTMSNEENPTHVYPDPGVYDVTLSIVVDDGCQADLSMTIENAIDVKPSPEADFSLSADTVSAFEPWVTLTDESIDGVEHWYYFTPQDSTSERNTDWAYLDGGNHYPLQVVTNSFGCKDTMIRRIYVIPHTTLYVPNAFTPDGNGLNEVFLPEVRDVLEYRFDIYTRWGNRIFTTDNPKQGWDGTHNGKPAGDGVYIYQIFFKKAHTNLNEIVRGHFTLIR